MKKKMKKTVAILTALMLFAGLLPVAALAEDGSPQPGAVAKYNGVTYGTLQEALSAATEGGEVTLLTNAGEGDLTFPADGITVNLGGHTLAISEGKKGFVVRNQKSLEDDLSNITIMNGTITGTRTAQWIDAIYARNLTLRDLTFSDMELVNGVDGISIAGSDAVMENCRIENVTGSVSTGAGAMIAVESGVLTMNSCTVENCEAGGSVIEAGVDSYLKTSPTLTMNDCRIAYNTGGYCGGLETRGAGSGNPWWAMITLNDTVITGNRARNKSYSGGGLNMTRTRFRMEGGALYGNFVPDDAEADNSGADVYVYKGYTNMVFPKASEMKDGNADLKGFFWLDTISNVPYADGIDRGRNENLTSPMGLKVDKEPLKVARNMRTYTEYTTLSEAVEAAQAGDALQLCAFDNGGAVTVTESTVILINKNLTIDLNGHDLNGLAANGNIFAVTDGGKLTLIGGRANDAGNPEPNEVDGAIENSGELEIIGAMTFKDKIFHKGRRFFITGNHGDLRVSLARDKYIEADADLAASRLRVYLLDAATRTVLNDRRHDCEDILIGKGGLAALEGITATPEIDNPFVRRVYKTDGPQGEGLYLVDRVPDGIYLDGVNGKDDNAGTEEAPVKTFARAKQLLEKKIADLAASSDGAKSGDACPDGIYVMNTVTVDGTENWSMPKDTEMIRHENLRGAVVYVTGSLTITDMVIDGLAEGGVTATAPLVDVDAGNLTIGSGAVLRNNINTVISTMASQPRVGGGVVGRNEAAVIMNGGSVTDNQAGLGGGIGLYGGASLEMNSGEISRNSALNAYHEGSSGSYAAGGGVFLSGKTSMSFSGGRISQNKSDCSGGGISLGGHTFNTITTDKTRKTVLNMTGGTVSENEAGDCGGGIFIQANTKADISGGTISGNSAQGAAGGLFAGGGIHVNSNAQQAYLDYGQLTLSSVLISENTAALAGGGIGAGPTSLVKSRPNAGAAICENDAPTARDVLVDHRTGVSVYGLRAEHSAYFSHYMPGGGEARWLRDGTELYQGPEQNGEPMLFENLLTRTALELSSGAEPGDIDKATTLAKVRVTGNYSGTRGGGIAALGDTYIGKGWTIKARKNWDDEDDADHIRPTSVKFLLSGTVEDDGKPVEIPLGDITTPTEVVLRAEDGWCYSWEDLPELVPEDIAALEPYKNREITYSVAEPEPAEGYTSSVAGNMFDGYTVTNSHTPKPPAPKPPTPDTPATANASISFDLNGGTLNGKTGVVTIKAEKGSIIKLPKPARDGYTFDYWEGSRYEAGASYKVEGDHSFRAQWKKNTATNTGEVKTAAPKTGDGRGAAVWFLLILLSGMALVGTGRAMKRSE